MTRRPKRAALLLFGISLILAVWNEAFYAYRSYQLDKPADTFSGPLHAAAPASDPLFGSAPTAAILRRTEESRIGMHYARGTTTPHKVSSWGQSRQTVSHADRLSLGSHSVDARTLATVAPFGPLTPTQPFADQIARAAPGHRVTIEGNYFLVESTLPQDPDAEFVPAFRLRFEQVPLASITLAGQVRNGILFPVAATNGSATDAVGQARKTASATHWFLRFLVAAGVFFGIRSLSKFRTR